MDNLSGNDDPRLSRRGFFLESVPTGAVLFETLK